MVREAIPASRKVQGESVGTFTFTLEVGSRDASRFQAVEALVDTGAIFSRVPASVLSDLGHEPSGRESFELGDGSIVEWEVGDVPVRIGDRVRVTTCIWGAEGTTSVLGAVTLEQFLLMVDPTRQEIVPIVGPFQNALRGKNYRAALEKIDRTRTYEPKEAVALVKEMAYAKFDESVELHVRTGLDTRHADQQLRGTIVLPHGLGKVGRLGRVLGPRGLMPNPRTNTVVEAEDLPKAIRDSKQGRVEFRTDRTNLVHVPLGKVSFSEDALMENLSSLIDAISREKPSGAKGQYIRSLTLTTTMGPGVKLDIPATLSMTTASTV